MGSAKRKRNAVEDVSPAERERRRLVQKEIKKEGRSEDGYCPEFEVDGKMVPLEVWMEYAESIKESEGFDVSSFPGLSWLTRIVPLNLEGGDIEDAVELAKKALRRYNKRKKRKYEYTEILKANAELVCGFRYYITFNAKEGSGDVIPFQTRVLHVPWER